MNRLESAEPLEPYLNPNYWSGHSIGYGQSMEWATVPLFGQALRQSSANLRERLASMEKVVPIETYKNGQVFDAEQQELGTVVLFRIESLFGHPDNLGVEVQSLAPQPLPARPMDVSPNFGREASSGEVISEGGGVMYLSMAKWGIVGASKKRHKVLHTAGTGAVAKLGDGRVILPNLDTLETPIVIGETRHYIAEKHGQERLERINVLDVVAYGETQRKKDTVVHHLAARLASTRGVA